MWRWHVKAHGNEVSQVLVKVLSLSVYIEPIADGLGNGTSSMLLLSGRTAGLMVLIILFTCWTE